MNTQDMIAYKATVVFVAYMVGNQRTWLGSTQTETPGIYKLNFHLISNWSRVQLFWLGVYWIWY